MAARNPLVIPSELSGSIVDNLRGDVRAFRECALTCRDWYPRSRYNLYVAVALQDRKQLYKFASTLDRSAGVPALVEEVSLECAQDCPDGFWRSASVVLFPRLERLRRLRILLTIRDTLDQSRRTSYTDRLSVPCQLNGLVSGSATLTHVAIEHVRRLSFIYVVRLLCGLPNLSAKWELRWLSWRGNAMAIPPDLPIHKPGCLKLKSLVMRVSATTV
ncbi:hypothetical protein C8Q79DRAFT_1015196 [Trametes meyenii]|nr:hypothetical protein C8Q79DRAFT_1015196 [Trametes meyenii]